MEGEPGRSTEARARGLGGVLVTEKPGVHYSVGRETVLSFWEEKRCVFSHCVGSEK